MATQTLLQSLPKLIPTLQPSSRGRSGNLAVAILGRTKTEHGWRTYPVVYGTTGRMKDKVIPNRFQRERSAFVFDPEFASVAFLRPVFFTASLNFASSQEFIEVRSMGCWSGKIS